MIFKKIKIDTTNWTNWKSKITRVSEKIYISESLIPQTHTEAKIVFFVSGTNGDEFGQFANFTDALNRANEIVEDTYEK